MADPLTDIVGLLRPTAPLSKLVVAGGSWAVRRSEDELPFFCAVLEGACRFAVTGRDPVVLERGDFVLLPSAYTFTASSLDDPVPAASTGPVETGPGLFRLGNPGAGSDVRLLVGHCAFGSYDARLLVSLLPQVVHIRGDRRLTTLVELVADEQRSRRPGRDAVLARLLEVLLIEALRAAHGAEAPPGLLRGLADERLAAPIRRMHDRPDRDWTVAALAREAGLLRSSFFARFRCEVGVAPIEYLSGWRMALAKDLLRRGDASIATVARQIGYGSASTFSVAFARHVGRPPALFARESSAAS